MGDISFFNENNIVDSLENDNFLGYSPIFFGSYILTQVYKKGELVSKVNKDGFVVNYPETWLKYNTFIDSTGSSVYYASEDLSVVK